MDTTEIVRPTSKDETNLDSFSLKTAPLGRIVTEKFKELPRSTSFEYTRSLMLAFRKV